MSEGNLIVKEARIIFRNFKGEASKFNPAGTRNFCLIIDDPNVAMKMAQDGWNVKQSKSRDEQDEPTFYIQVKVSYGVKPPTVYLITSKGKTLLDEESIGILDNTDIKQASVSVSPYPWTIETKEGVKSGIKGYLKTLYVVAEEDEFEEMYAQQESPEEDLDEDMLPF